MPASVKCYKFNHWHCQFRESIIFSVLSVCGGNECIRVLSYKCYDYSFMISVIK